MTATTRKAAPRKAGTRQSARRKAPAGPPADEARETYRLMTLARQFEEQLGEVFASGRLAGWFHSCIGHEATGANYRALLREDDHLVPYHRSRVSLFAKGMTPLEVALELMGRAAAPSRGRGGDGHMVHAGRRICGMSGVLGASIPIAVGLAYASQLRGTDEVTISSFGEGTSNRGAVFEGMNLAAIWDLPVVFVCENNLYAEFSAAKDQMRITDVADRAAGVGILGVVVDGNDPDASRVVLAEAIERARSGGGPTLVEAKTYRLKGHYEGDPQGYRPRSEIEEWAARDPLPTYRARLIERDVLTDETADALEREAGDEVRAAIAEALDAPLPTETEIVGGVYEQELETA